MSELLNKIKVYNIECYPNLFMVAFYSYSENKYLTFSIFSDKNIDERDSIIKYFLASDIIWCGYNNFSYEDLMIHHLIMLCHHKDKVDEDFVLRNQFNWDKDSPYFKIYQTWYKVNLDLKDKNLSTTELTIKLHKYSTILINGAKGKYTKKINIKSIDLFKIIPKDSNIKCLKDAAIKLKHHCIQDLPITPNINISAEQFKLINTYNINNVNITIKILELSLPKIEMCSFLTKYYNGEVDLLCESDSGICEKLLTMFYQKKLTETCITYKDKHWEFRKHKTIHGDIRIADIVYKRISFLTHVLQKFYDEILQHTILKMQSCEKFDRYVWDYKLEFCGNTYRLGLDGIYSEDKPVIYKNDDKYLTLDLNITSMYPSALIYNSICPAHLNKTIFLEILSELLVESVKYKKLYKQTKDSSYNNLQRAIQIVLNTLFDLTNSKMFWLFDTKVTFTCTVNNQLLILMLIEDFALKNYRVISANISGITVRIMRDQLAQLREDYAKWEIMSGFKLEEIFYDKYIRFDVNNYITVSSDGEIKYNGIFTPQGEKDFLVGFDYPVVAQALGDYFLKGVPIEKNIKGCKNIYDFCFSLKCGRHFTNWLQLIERKKLLRYGKNLENIYVKPRLEDTIVKETQVQPNLRLFVSEPDSFETPDYELFNGYDNVYYRGYSLKKKKMCESKRYDVVKDDELKKYWRIRDLKTGENISKRFSSKKATAETLAQLNEQDDAVIEVEQVSDYIAGRFITLFNNFFSVDNFAQYKVDYQYYIDLAQAEIDKLEITV
jgi:hypothetical protein